MRSKYHRRGTLAPGGGSPRTSQMVVALALFVAGAAVALSAEWVVTSTPGRGPAATAAPSAPPNAASSPLGSTEPAASAAPSASPSPAAPALEAEMPHTVNGTTLTIESATGATSLGNSPGNRALDAAVTGLGKTAADLEVADAYDASGSLALSVLGFRVAGVAPAKLRPLVLDAWLSINTPGVTSSNVSLSGTSATKVSYADGGPSEYLFVHGDSLLLVETIDQALAVNVVEAIAVPSPSPSGG